MISHSTEEIPGITYDQIITEAKKKAAELKEDLPSLPTEEELEPYGGWMWTVDRQLIDATRRHLDEWGVGHGHGFEEHLEWVAKVSAYVADMECRKRDIGGNLRNEIVQRAWRLGFLHDLQRWRGWEPERAHTIEGMKATRQKLEELGIDDNYLLDQVLLHDKLKVQPRNDPRFDIPFFSVFAVDHLNYGTQWEENFWRGMAGKNVPPKEAIHDYEFMTRLRESPNLQQIEWGREVVIPYIDFGISIAKHIEGLFSDN